MDENLDSGEGEVEKQEKEMSAEEIMEIGDKKDLQATKPVETAEDPESVQEREAAEYEDRLNELHDNLDEIKGKGREMHQALHEKADDAETVQLEKRFRRLAQSAFNLTGRLQDGDREVLRAGINVED